MQIVGAALQLPIIIYITDERWMVHADAACALILGKIILSVLVRVGDSILGNLGNGDVRMHPLGRFPTRTSFFLTVTPAAFLFDVSTSSCWLALLSSSCADAITSSGPTAARVDVESDAVWPLAYSTLVF